MHRPTQIALARTWIGFRNKRQKSKSQFTARIWPPDTIKKWRFEKPCLKSPSTTQNEPSGHVLELQPPSTLTRTVYTKV